MRLQTVSRCRADSAIAAATRRRGHVLQGSLRHGYPAALEVLAQTLVELCEASQLQLGHALLLRLAIAAGPDLVGRSSHCSGHRGA